MDNRQVNRQNIPHIVNICQGISYVRRAALKVGGTNENSARDVFIRS
jgi:hypothetical protein